MLRFNLASFLLFGLVFGSDTDYIKFPHELHVMDEEIECVTCHEGVSQSTSLSERLVPSMDICSDCHEVDDDDNCEMCHANTDDPLTYSDFQPTSGLTYSHAFHLKRFSDCFNCHNDIKTDDGQSRPVAWKKSDCSICHLANRPKSHTPDWIPIHGMELMGIADTPCSMCHQESYCDRCHARQQIEPRVHTSDYLIGHGLDSRAGIIDCGTCHDLVSDCATCHKQHQAMPLDHSLPTWVGLFLDEGGEHSRAAEDAPMTCKACHISNNEPACVRCHK